MKDKKENEIDEKIKIVQDFYDSDVEEEWLRLEKHPFEFLLTIKMMERYIKPGDKILDIGGGPGRYSLYFAQKGYDVTLVDLSSRNVEHALKKAEEMHVKLKAVAGDARLIDKIAVDSYDHVFIMGPMYHLLEERDRIQAINGATNLLKEGGKLYVSFILMFAGMIYGMKYMPEMLLLEKEHVFIDAVLRDGSYGGDAFTKSFFISQKEILPFMEQFSLEKMHLFGQEGILSPCESNILAQPQEVIDKWVDIAEKLCEREELLSYSEHIMYVGMKK